jgi:hypothetical protein
VYCLDHTDGTCLAYKNDSTDPPETILFKPYDEKIHKVSKTEYRRKQLDQRIIDIKHVIDLIKEEANAEDLNIDLSKLIALGHSMGGITAIEMCKEFPLDFKLCCSLDAYYQPRYRQIVTSSDYALTQPLLLLNSELFNNEEEGYTEGNEVVKYNRLKANDKIFEESKTKSGQKDR